MVNDIFINKVEASGIIALDLIDFKPTMEIVEFDIKSLLFMEMIVKEKEFRASLFNIDLSQYKGKAVALICSVDAIIPSWIYMVLADVFHGNAIYFDFKDKVGVELDLWKKNLVETNLLMSYKHKKVVVRARPDIPPALYITATELLKPLVKTLMYGEIGMPKVIYKKQEK